MISYTEKGPWLPDEIAAQGYHFHIVGGVPTSDDDVAVQAIIDTFDPLPYAKSDKRNEIKAEGAKRVAAVYAFMVETDENGEQNINDVVSFYEFAKDIYLSILPAARGSLQPRLQSFNDIYQTTKDAIATVNAMTDWQAVMAYDVVSTPDWP